MTRLDYIRLAKCTLTTDPGTEFKCVFQEYLNNHNVFHRVGIPDRQKQTANVEYLNKQLGRLIMGYLNQIKEKTKITAVNWLPIIINLIQDKLNKTRIIKVPNDINVYVISMIYIHVEIKQMKMANMLNQNLKLVIQYIIVPKSHLMF